MVWSKYIACLDLLRECYFDLEFLGQYHLDVDIVVEIHHGVRILFEFHIPLDLLREWCWASLVNSVQNFGNLVIQ